MEGITSGGNSSTATQGDVRCQSPQYFLNSRCPGAEFRSTQESGEYATSNAWRDRDAIKAEILDGVVVEASGPLAAERGQVKTGIADGDDHVGDRIVGTNLIAGPLLPKYSMLTTTVQSTARQNFVITRPSDVQRRVSLRHRDRRAFETSDVLKDSGTSVAHG